MSGTVLQSSPLLEGIWPANDDNRTWKSLNWEEKESRSGTKTGWMCVCASTESNQRRRDKKRKNTSNDPFKDPASLRLPRLTQPGAVNLGCKNTSNPPRQSKQLKLLRQADSSAEAPNIQMRAHHPGDLLWFLRSASSKATCHTARRAQTTQVAVPLQRLVGDWKRVDYWIYRRHHVIPTNGWRSSSDTVQPTQSSASERIAVLGWLLANIYYQ